jgi:hypothetical protein
MFKRFRHATVIFKAEFNQSISTIATAVLVIIWTGRRGIERERLTECPSGAAALPLQFKHLLAYSHHLSNDGKNASRIVLSGQLVQFKPD